MPYKLLEESKKHASLYYYKNRDKYAENFKKRYKEHREEILAYQKQKMQKPSNRIKANEWHRARDRRYRQEVIKIFGSKCVKCGFTDWRALQVDHINGGGNKERIITYKRNTWDYVKNLLKGDKTKYQLLCANCNKIKQYEDHEFANQWSNK